MASRLALHLALLAVVIIGCGFFAAVASVRDTEQRQSVDALLELTHSHALELQTRLLAAEAIVQAASAVEPYGGGATIRQRLLHSEAIRGMVLLPPAAAQAHRAWPRIPSPPGR